MVASRDPVCLMSRDPVCLMSRDPSMFLELVVELHILGWISDTCISLGDIIRCRVWNGTI